MTTTIIKLITTTLENFLCQMLSQVFYASHLSFQ